MKLGVAAIAALLTSGSAGAACIVSNSVERVLCRPASVVPHAPIDPTGAYQFYRFLGARTAERRCRLQPTCSRFAVEAVAELGVIRGLFLGLARSQMEHSSQGGYLLPEMASDGRFIFVDPLATWIRHLE